MDNILIFGDSHARYFEVTAKIKSHAPWLNQIKSKVFKYPASTIIGFGKRQSTLNVGKKIADVIADDSSSTRVFCFGQVDLELGYYYKKVIKEELINYDEFITNLIEEYCLFLSKYDNGKLIVKGLNLTVLKNEDFAVKYVSRIITENTSEKAKVQYYTEKLKSELAPFRIRNKAHLDFNVKLKAKAKENGWQYFDINEELSNYTAGKGVLDQFIPAGDDHHLVDSIFVRILHLSKLKGIL